MFQGRTGRENGGCRWRGRACRAGLFSVLLASCAAAQQPALSDDPELKRRHDAAFAEVFAHPSDRALNLRYAEVATQLGDIEAAIGALERVLYTEPDLAEVRYQLGVLYFRLAAYPMARSYFESADPAGHGAEVASYLAEIERRLQTTSLSFSAQLGFRHQSNANAGPSSAAIKALGYDTVVPGDSARRADGNAFATATLRYAHDLENQRGDLIEAQVTGYHARQFALERLNTGLVEASFGPRLMLAPDHLPGWSIKPYGLAGAIALADRPYVVNGGGGITAALPLAGVLLEPGVELRRRSFRNSTDNPVATDQRGRLLITSLAASGYLGASLRWSARGFVNRNDALVDYHSYRAVGGDIGVAWQFDPPFMPNSARWTLFPFGGWTKSVYDSPNPSVDPAVRRKDREWRVGANLNMPIWTNAGLGLLVQYSNTGSNIPNFRTRNLSVTFGPTVQF